MERNGLMQVGQLQLQISSLTFERAFRDLVVVQYLDAAKRGGNITKPRTLSTITCRDKTTVQHPSEAYSWSPRSSHR